MGAQFQHQPGRSGPSSAISGDLRAFAATPALSQLEICTASPLAASNGVADKSCAGSEIITAN
jgi:hypothetical protein